MYPKPGRKILYCVLFNILLHETKNTETRESIRLQLSSYIYVGIVEQKNYAVSVKDKAMNVISQFDEPNNREATNIQTKLNRIYYYRVRISVLFTFLKTGGGGADEYFTPISNRCTNDRRRVSIFNGC